MPFCLLHITLDSDIKPHLDDGDSEGTIIMWLCPPGFVPVKHCREWAFLLPCAGIQVPLCDGMVSTVASPRVWHGTVLAEPTASGFIGVAVCTKSQLVKRAVKQLNGPQGKTWA